MTEIAGVRIGAEVSGYRVEELIGRGGMGEVYRAWDERPIGNWIGELGLAAQERELASRMREEVAGEYRAVSAEAESLIEAPGVHPSDRDAGTLAIGFPGPRSSTDDARQPKGGQGDVEAAHHEEIRLGDEQATHRTNVCYAHSPSRGGLDVRPY